MQSIAESIATPYTGSEMTRDMVRAQIAERWGEDEAEKYDPYTNARTYAQWTKLGYRVKKAQTALRSTTFLDARNQRGEPIKIPRTVCLFYRLQVEKV